MQVLFDLDGTLTNPRRGITACIRYALEALDEPIPGDTELDQWIGPPLHHSFLSVLGHPDRADQAVALYRDRFATLGLYENQVYFGIPDALSMLTAAGHTLWVCTSKPQPFAVKIIRHFQLASFFSGIYGSELNGTRANKSDLINHVLQTESIAPATAVMIGDRAYDIIGAKENDVPSIGVLWGFGAAAELSQAGAIALCSSPADLLSLVSSSQPS